MDTSERKNPQYWIRVTVFDDCDDFALSEQEAGLLQRLARSPDGMSISQFETVFAREMVARGIPLEISDLDPKDRRKIWVNQWVTVFWFES